jgi:membrane protease YdiL (CAAX protease family)
MHTTEPPLEPAVERPEPVRPAVPPPPGPSTTPPRRRWQRQPHTEPRPYLQLLRTPTYRWWKPLVGLLVAVLCFVLGSIVVGVADEIADGLTDADLVADLEAGRTPGAWQLLSSNLSIILFGVAAGAAVLAVHTERFGWLSSVIRRLRWRPMLACAAYAAVLLGAFLALLVFVPGLGGEGGSDPVDPPPPGSIPGLLAVVLLTTPLQAAAEEYLFRGYLSQVIGAWVRPRVAGAVVATLVSATLFALAHGQTDPFTFGDKFAFGVTASVAVLLTGGLEAAIALHVSTNVIVLSLAVLSGEMQSATEAAGDETVPPGVVLGLMAVNVLYLAGVCLWVRRRPPLRRSAVASTG